MIKKILPIFLASLILVACSPKPPLVILHNSCPAYSELRSITLPTSYMSDVLDSMGVADSLGEPDSAFSIAVDNRITIHPEDRVWLSELDSLFPVAEIIDGEDKGIVHVWVGASGISFDSVPFTRKVLVLNGTSKPGLARDAAYGFNVKFGLSSLEPSNADSDTFTQTTVYCPSGEVHLGEKLCDYLGAGQVIPRVNLRDIIIVIGSDILEENKVEKAPGGISIVIKKSLFEMLVFKDGKLIKTYPVALGRNAGDKQRVGDNRTPEGSFTVTSIENSSAWEHDFGDGKGPIKGAYGPWFIRLSTLSFETRSGNKWVGIGIHGTHDPASIGTRASEGCIRMHNEDVDSLKRMVKVGTPVRIEK
ncbi:L,D-transpeptidase family protein [candidate division WOR-3 bacterium]|uniref:L,D-transpeptidase family protein n=1 Tax=candidate division WOR-3 bacterium TaxID=2052148 RepID=A0A9D5K9C6_UNCW3|nr:L,D-transpeptidase family protein [candidate division WOR-3 bacterium]MBD3364863.1 L,D-transpeptidase family protein [candidate division WOR-3 bacterium]